MKYNKSIILKDGRECLLRDITKDDAKESLRIFNLTHEQTDFLLAYNDDLNLTEEDEAKYLEERSNSDRAVFIAAFLDGKMVGTSFIEGKDQFSKTRHKAEFGINIDKDYWRLGIGKALMQACIECARQAKFKQIVLEVIGDNTAAINLYKAFGFVEYGRNPKGFKSKYSGWQEEVLMYLDLEV